MEPKAYYENDLPSYLAESLEGWKRGQEKLANGEDYMLWDCDYCDLQSSINVAEVDQAISTDQAWYLREKYLGLNRKEIQGYD